MTLRLILCALILLALGGCQIDRFRQRRRVPWRWTDDDPLKLSPRARCSAEVKIQARHLYISARKRGSLGHAGKLAYPTKPLNVESLHRSIRTHKEQGNHPARVIVDIQFPCDRMPPAGSMRGGKSSHARNRVGSTAGAPCQFTWEIIVKWKRTVETAG